MFFREENQLYSANIYKNLHIKINLKRHANHILVLPINF